MDPLSADRPSAAAWGSRLGLSAVPVAVVALPTAAVAAAHREWAVLAGLGVPVAAGALGGCLAWACRPGERDRATPSRAQALGLVWLLATAVAAAPFLAAAHLGDAPSASTAALGSPLNAAFEAMSGLTTSGLSVAGTPEELPASLLWWRSSLSWLGGLGLLYLALSIGVLDGRKRTGDDDQDAGDELGSGEDGQDGPGLRGVLWWTWAAYLGLTLAACAAYRLAGMSLWDAANHAQSAVSTGGFSTRAASLDAFGPPAQAVTLLFVLLGAISFAPIRAAVFGRDPRGLFRDAQARWLVVGVAVGGPLLWLASGLDAWTACFQWAMALTTGGFGLVKTQDLPALTLCLLVPAALVGAGAGSTGGGLKLGRLRRLLRWAAGRGTAEDELDETRLQTLKVAAAFCVSFLLGTLGVWLAAGRPPWAAAAFEAASALGNGGLSAGITGPDAPAAARGVLMTLMWLGRLEFVLLFELVLKKRRR